MHWLSVSGLRRVLQGVLQVGGFLQRIDYVRKHAFAVMCILKDSQGQFPIRYWGPVPPNDVCVHT